MSDVKQKPQPAKPPKKINNSVEPKSILPKVKPTQQPKPTKKSDK